MNQPVLFKTNETVDEVKKSPISNKLSTNDDFGPALWNNENGNATSEEERIQAVINAASQIPISHNFPSSQSNPIKKIPPRNYICHRCLQPGHFIRDCPTNGDSSKYLQKFKNCGIPKSLLVTSPNGTKEFRPNE